MRITSTKDAAPKYVRNPCIYQSRSKWKNLLGLSNGELESDVLAGKGTVDRREGVELVLEQVLVLGVKEDAGELAAVRGDACPLAGDLGRPDEVLEDLLVDGGEGARTGALLAGGSVGVALGLGEDTALRKEDDELVGELLLELTGEPVGGRKIGIMAGCGDW